MKEIKKDLEPEIDSIDLDDLARLIQENVTETSDIPMVEAVVSEVKDLLATVSVGSVEHPMQEDHYIKWIILETTEGIKVKNEATDYMVIGDLLFIHIPADKFGDKTPFYVVHKMIYTPNATAMGDIMTMKSIAKAEGGYVAGTSSWLRVKQYLNLDNKVNDYSSAYLSNVKGKDEDFSILGNTLNIAKIEANDFDMMFRSVLSCFEFDANYFAEFFCFCRGNTR